VADAGDRIRHRELSEGGSRRRGTRSHTRDQHIVAAPRAGWLRTSPHFYIAPEDIDRLVDALSVKRAILQYS